MRAAAYMVCGVLILGVVGCASTAPTAPDEQKVTVSPEAQKLIEQQGEATAAERGTSTESELICETRKKLGSHMVEQFCYTRAQADKAREAAQESLRNATRGGPRADQ